MSMILYFIDISLERVDALSRDVNPTVYSAAEFSKRAKNKNALIRRVLEGAKVWVIGTENDLRVLDLRDAS